VQGFDTLPTAKRPMYIRVGSRGYLQLDDTFVRRLVVCVLFNTMRSFSPRLDCVSGPRERSLVFSNIARLVGTLFNGWMDTSNNVNAVQD